MTENTVLLNVEKYNELWILNTQNALNQQKDLV